MSKPKFVVHKDPTFPNGRMLMGYQGRSMIDTGIYAPYVDYESVLEPSAVERLGGLVDPELQEEIEARDEARGFKFKTFDMLPDPAVPDAYPTPSTSGGGRVA